MDIQDAGIPLLVCEYVHDINKHMENLHNVPEYFL